MHARHTHPTAPYITLSSTLPQYALFDPTTQMAYIPLDEESKVSEADERERESQPSPCQVVLECTKACDFFKHKSYVDVVRVSRVSPPLLYKFPPSSRSLRRSFCRLPCSVRLAPSLLAWPVPRFSFGVVAVLFPSLIVISSPSWSLSRLLLLLAPVVVCFVRLRERRPSTAWGLGWASRELPSCSKAWCSPSETSSTLLP